MKRNELRAVEQTPSKIPPLLREHYEETMRGKGLAAAKREIAEDSLPEEPQT